MNKTKDKNWIKKHPVWSGIIGLVVLFFVIAIFTPSPSVDYPNDLENIEDKQSHEELSLSLQQKIYYRLVELQDSISFEDEKYAEKMDASFLVVAEYYNISEEKVNEIVRKGLTESWPMPVYAVDTQDTETTTTEENEIEKEWHEIKTFSGTGYKTTDTFTITGSKFKLTYTTNGANEYSMLSFFVYPEGETTMYTEMISTNMGFSGTDDSISYAGAGTYYLNIISANLDSWSIKIEDYY